MWCAATQCCSGGTGGLPPDQANISMANLAASTHTLIGIDGYPQPVPEIPDGLFAGAGAVKLGLDVLLGAGQTRST